MCCDSLEAIFEGVNYFVNSGIKNATPLRTYPANKATDLCGSWFKNPRIYADPPGGGGGI
jgi:hypothetical protein